uniref:Calponin-homology (CH) domain-containing protein n=1 Tax=Globodera pallida TaxID=36090 RepID=A0A183BUZ1_GLOPA
MFGIPVRLKLQKCLRAESRTPLAFRSDYDEEAPNATMETKVAGGGAAPKRVGRWTLAQLRQTDGIIPSQAGWNKGDSQKMMTNFGTPRNTTTKVKVENLAEIPEDILLKGHGEVRLQSGTNRFASQKGFVAFGTGRDVCREGVNVNVLPGDLEPLPEEKIRASDGIVRLQAGTNKFDSQKGMTLFGTGRRETTRMLDSKHPDYSHERDIDNTEIPLQMGTNKFASQKGMTGFGTNRRETTKMLDTSHPGKTGFGTPRNTQTRVEFADYDSNRRRWCVLSPLGMPDTEVRLQSGTNKFDSQKLMTNFGTPRDVKGKHLKRIWELEFPEEAADYQQQMPPVNAAPQQQQAQPQAQPTAR